MTVEREMEITRNRWNAWFVKSWSCGTATLLKLIHIPQDAPTLTLDLRLVSFSAFTELDTTIISIVSLKRLTLDGFFCLKTDFSQVELI